LTPVVTEVLPVARQAGADVANHALRQLVWSPGGHPTGYWQ
jgi:hypothetical protein